ncbi:MAG: hydrogenase maturation nickel metallochaperone HypA [Proteobacteria bacterium]|nr:hydrogenase maturation nickel metallochaperone HypA [Pseudomonadota bacterium]MCG6936185.1 hydrogenase maturation nickel metallochaperone HypA [Pseudomonadota bacterium]
MHELAICQSMLQQVEQIAQERQATAVIRITVSIGPLSGVEAHLLSQAFPLAAAGSIARDAELVIETLPVRVKCEQCGAETEARPNRLLCGTCGDYHTRLLSGDEMLLASLELTSETREANHV